jgi:hypothetical protein
LSVDGINGFDANGNATGEVEAKNLAVVGSFGSRLPWNKKDLRWGGTLKHIRETLDGDTVQGLAGDIGVLVRVSPPRFLARPGRQWRWGAAWQNLGSGHQASLPRTLRVGAMMDFGGTLCALDGVFPRSEHPWLGLGVEQRLMEMVVLRFGYRGDTDLGSGLRVGMGFTINRWTLDYALASYGDLETTHRIGASFKFDTPREPGNIQVKLAEKLSD